MGGALSYNIGSTQGWGLEVGDCGEVGESDYTLLCNFICLVECQTKPVAT